MSGRVQILLERKEKRGSELSVVAHVVDPARAMSVPYQATAGTGSVLPKKGPCIADLAALVFASAGGHLSSAAC
jgi:hypothetical protein